MNKYRGLLVFSLAVAFGLMAVLLANKWLTSRNDRATVAVKDTIPLAKIVVAAKDIGVGTPLNKDTLTLAEWPQTNLPKGIFHDVAALQNRVAVTRILAGQPVVDAALAAPGSGAGLVAKIPSGKRAIAISVDEVTGVGGFVLPDTAVDVHCVEPCKGGGQSTKVILKNIKVLAIAQEAVKEDGKAKIVHTVTLEVEPKQAEILALQSAQRGSSIHLALRTPLDDGEKAPVVAAVTDVPTPVKPISKPKRQVYYTPKPSAYTIEVLRGSAKPEKVRFKNLNSDERL